MQQPSLTKASAPTPALGRSSLAEECSYHQWCCALQRCVLGSVCYTSGHRQRNGWQWLSWKAGGNKRHRQFYHFCLLFLKKKTLGASLTSASQTLKRNIIHTFSRGSFLLMGGDFFRQKGDIFCFKLIKGGSSSTSTAPCLASRRKRKPGTRVGSCLPSRWHKKYVCILGFAMCAMVQSRYYIRMVISSFVRNPSQEY